MTAQRHNKWVAILIMAAMIVPSAAAAGKITFPLPADMMTDEEAILQLVNAQYLFDDAAFKKDLVILKIRTSNDTEMRLRRVASRAAADLFAAAEADGLRLYCISAYRDLATQRALYYNDVAEKGYDDRSTQIPGASEHQTGLALDIVSREWLGYNLTEEFAATPEAQWLASHCADYGFIIRYPKAKEDITGIIYEPWHLRYVGFTAARYLTDNNMTLEELWLQWYLYLEDNAL